MLKSEQDVETIMQGLGIEAMDDSALESLCRELLDANPQAVDAYRGGKIQAIGPLIGQAKQKNPNANPGKVRELLIQILEN